MPKGFKTFATHTSLQAPPASIRPAIAGAPQDVGGGTDLALIDPETVASRYLRNALHSEDMPELAADEVNGQESEFKSLGVETILLTNTRTVKYRQYYDKIPVYGSLVTVELDENNELLSISSALGSPQNIDSVATVSPARALQIARKLSGNSAKDSLESMPRLYYYFDQEVERWRLVYIIEDVAKQTKRQKKEAQADMGIPNISDYVIDAHTAELVNELPRTAMAQAISTQMQAPDGLGKIRDFWVEADAQAQHHLVDRQHNVQTYDFDFRDAYLFFNRLPGELIALTPQKPWPPAAVSAHANAASVVNFMKTTLMRDSLDNRGGPVISSINCIYDSASGSKVWRNAAWWRGQMLYGQRDQGGELISYAVAEDIVAHELFHGVTELTARLEYRGESGALNESYSDIFGVILSNINEPNIATWNWQMGEELTGTPLRDLSDPTKHNQPAHMQDFKVLPDNSANDYGGVHINSGIHNKAIYNILTAKHQGNYLFDGRTVAQLAYLTLSQELSRTSTFQDSRHGMLLRATTLFRKDPLLREKRAAIAIAFEDVGIQQ